MQCRECGDPLSVSPEHMWLAYCQQTNRSDCVCSTNPWLVTLCQGTTNRLQEHTGSLTSHLTRSGRQRCKKVRMLLMLAVQFFSIAVLFFGFAGNFMPFFPRVCTFSLCFFTICYFYAFIHVLFVQSFQAKSFFPCCFSDFLQICRVAPLGFLLA